MVDMHDSYSSSKLAREEEMEAESLIHQDEAEGDNVRELYSNMREAGYERDDILEYITEHYHIANPERHLNEGETQ